MVKSSRATSFPTIANPPDNKTTKYADLIDGVIAQFETVTPIAMVGATKNQTELRESSFRGVLHYWLRAWLGGKLGSNISLLREIESVILGSTVNGSPIAMRVLFERDKRGNEQKIENQHTRIVISDTGAINLAAYEMAEFTIRTKAKLGQEVLSQTLELLFRLMSSLGGIGKRSRRGYGSLFLSKYDGQAFPLPAGIEALEEQYRILLRNIEAHIFRGGLVYSVFSDPAGSIKLPSYPIIHPEYCKILLCKKAYRTYEDAMQKFWEVRNSTAFKGNRVFGGVQKATPPKKAVRIASPIHFHIACSHLQKREREPEKQYYQVFTAFRTDLTDPDTGRSLDWGKASAFLDKMKADCDGVYIHGETTVWGG